MALFEFKSAALGTSISYELHPDRIVQLGGDGVPAKEVAFSAITQLRFSSRNVRLIRFAYFDITAGEDRLRLACTAPAASWKAEPDSQAFCDLVEAVCEALAQNRPDLSVALGDAYGWRIAWFILALAMALFGFGLPTFAFMEGVDTDRLIVVAPVMAAMGLFGAWLAWASRPWRAPVRLGLKAFLEIAPKVLRSNAK